MFFDALSIAFSRYVALYASSYNLLGVGGPIGLQHRERVAVRTSAGGTVHDRAAVLEEDQFLELDELFDATPDGPHAEPPFRGDALLSGPRVAAVLRCMVRDREQHQQRVSRG